MERSYESPKNYLLNIFLNRFVIPCMLPVFMLAGCGTTDSGELITLKGSWSPEGLEEMKINVLEPDGDELIIGTETGLFFLEQENITFLGLADYGIRGAVRTGDQSLLVGETDLRRRPRYCNHQRHGSDDNRWERGDLFWYR